MSQPIGCQSSSYPVTKPEVKNPHLTPHLSCQQYSPLSSNFIPPTDKTLFQQTTAPMIVGPITPSPSFPNISSESITASIQLTSKEKPSSDSQIPSYPNNLELRNDSSSQCQVNIVTNELDETMVDEFDFEDQGNYLNIYGISKVVDEADEAPKSICSTPPISLVTLTRVLCHYGRLRPTLRGKLPLERNHFTTWTRAPKAQSTG